MTNLTDEEISRIHSRMSDPSVLDLAIKPGLNTPEFEFALGLVRLIMTGSPGSIEAVRQPTDADMLEKNRGEFALEEILFCLYLIAKSAFSQETVNKRESFMGALVTNVGLALWQAYGIGIEASRFMQYFLNVYDARTEEYAGFKDPAAEGESRKGELLWEYGKRMAALISPQKSAARVTVLGWLAMRRMEGLIALVRKVIEQFEAGGTNIAF